MADDDRPDPDALLADVRQSEPEARRGRLTVFFGASAGVGKTYAMLEAAQQRKRQGVDVVVGVVETHGRPETAALLEGLDVMPRQRIAHGGTTLEEMDLDGVLARSPRLVLVDELAHSNAPGSRHAKRWQDVDELLGAGLDVYTSLNVQHVESLNDVVARITHVKVRETVPDAVLEHADEVALVDLTPDELLGRLREGKVYVPAQAQRAMSHFFRRGNLMALRQLALRQTAERVDADMRLYRRAHAVTEVWPVRERILVGVGPAPSSQRLVRATKRLADRLGAEWTAVFVETPGYATWSREDRNRVWETLRLAERLGAQTATIGGRRAAELLAYARRTNATKIVVGKPAHGRWRDRLLGSKLDQMARASGDVDVYVISGPEPGAGGPRLRVEGAVSTGGGRAYPAAAAAVVACTAVAFGLRPYLGPATLLMLYLLAVVAVATRAGRGPSVLASFLSVAAFDFFCVPPFYTFAVADTQYVVVFAVMLGVALLVSTLTVRLRSQAAMARRSEHRTAALRDLAADLIRARDGGDVFRTAHAHLRATFHAEPMLLVPDALGDLQAVGASAASESPGTAPAAAPVQAVTRDAAVARWVWQQGKPAGRGTDTLPEASALFLPLRASQRTLGVLGITLAAPAQDPEVLHELEAFATQIAAAVQRVELADEMLRAERVLQASRIRAEFLDRWSRELRRPIEQLQSELAALARSPTCDPKLRSRLDRAATELQGVGEHAAELSRVSRLETGRMMRQRRPLQPAALLQHAAALLRAEATAAGVGLSVETTAGLPPVMADADRIGDLLQHLIGRAIARAGPNGRVEVAADRMGDWVQLTVADNGPAIPPSAQESMFPAGDATAPRPGEPASLRDTVRAHGGELWVDSGPGPGCIVALTLPVAPLETVPTAPTGSAAVRSPAAGDNHGPRPGPAQEGRTRGSSSA
jgi:two-component system, OmpR family, sensor histidine kinase KdpD